jgi:hypothetical protein
VDGVLREWEAEAEAGRERMEWAVRRKGEPSRLPFLESLVIEISSAFTRSVSTGPSQRSHSAFVATVWMVREIHHLTRWIARNTR